MTIWQTQSVPKPGGTVRSGLIALTGVFLALAGCGGSDSDAIRPDNAVPNVIVIAIDTVRWDTWWIPERTGSTDAFSEWAREAEVFSRAVSAAPWTVPSVATVLTGLYPSQHGGGLFQKPVANLDQQVPSTLNPAVPTLAEILDTVGLQTAAVSAHPWFDANYGLERGFQQLSLRTGAEKVTRRGLQWLDEEAAKGEPYFLYLHYMDAHDPHLDLEASQSAIAAMSEAEHNGLMASAPESACGQPDSVICVRYLRYAQATLKLRESIAHLLEELRSRGAPDDTLIVLYSDHGEEFHDHQARAEARGRDPRGFYGFGHGNSLYQELLHVPLMIWHPDLEGGEVTTPVSLIDIVPSVVDWMGISLPEKIEYPGRSFVSLIEENRAPGAFGWSEETRQFPPSHDRELFASGIAYGPEQMSVVSQGFKLIWHEADNAREFYNLADDPLEQTPASGDDVAVADELDAELGDYFEWFDSQDYLPPELSDDVVERLKGVGYLQGVESRQEEEPETETDRGSEGGEP